jgi:hypothetical protein
MTLDDGLGLIGTGIGLGVLAIGAGMLLKTIDNTIPKQTKRKRKRKNYRGMI